MPSERRSLLALLCLLLGFASCARERVAETEIGGAALGTTYSVKIVAPAALEAVDRNVLEDAIEAAIEAVDRSMSTYREDSELSALNRAPAEQPISVSDELFSLLEKALEIGAQSDGAFDVTVGPLVNAWGFGPHPVDGIPSDAEIDLLLERVGATNLVLDSANHTVTKLHADLYVDLSAIAKGLAVDRVAEAAAALGYTNYLVEIGGEVRGRGSNREGLPWRVAIEKPPARDGDGGGGGPGASLVRSAQRIVPLRDQALATSGDYRNYIEVDGRRYSHEIDPRTGRPVEHGATSVSVLHPEALWADGYATALLVLGPDRGMHLARERNLAAQFLVYNAQGSLEERLSPALADYLPQP